MQKEFKLEVAGRTATCHKWSITCDGVQLPSSDYVDWVAHSWLKTRGDANVALEQGITLLVSTTGIEGAHVSLRRRPNSDIWHVGYMRGVWEDVPTLMPLCLDEMRAIGFSQLSALYVRIDITTVQKAVKPAKVVEPPKPIEPPRGFIMKRKLPDGTTQVTGSRIVEAVALPPPPMTLAEILTCISLANDADDTEIARRLLYEHDGQIRVLMLDPGEEAFGVFLSPEAGSNKWLKQKKRSFLKGAVDITDFELSPNAEDISRAFCKTRKHWLKLVPTIRVCVTRTTYNKLKSTKILLGVQS